MAARTKSTKGPKAPPPSKPMRLSRRDGGLHARYDAAQTNDDNRNHWASADALSAKAAHSPAIRRTLRMRSRYEIANCPLARGILRKHANFVVGTGPRVQILTRDRQYNQAVAREFGKWAVRTKYARKLRQLVFAWDMNGEGFGVFFTNRALRHPVKLDLRTVEADQVADPTLTTEWDEGSDGILYDDFGNPAGYRILKQHPGDAYGLATLVGDFDTESARNVVHLFTEERAGQVRGVPKITAALPLFAMRRRYMLAVLAAAETAADFSALLHTQQTATTTPDDVEPLDAIDIERRMLMTLPKGWTVSQLKAEQPVTTFEMFDNAIVREIARCVDMPYGVAAGDSSGYNFASGKLDLTPWFQTVRVEQDDVEDVIADPTFDLWYAEAVLLPGYLPPSPAGDRTPPPRRWFWDGQELLDPREATANAEALRTGQQTLGRLWARKGLDVEEEWEAEAGLYGRPVEELKRRIFEQTYSLAGSPAAADPAAEEADDAQAD